MTIGERIREERKKQGLTQKRLGELCGIAEPTIRKYELGKLNPKYQTSQKIADALDVDTSYLMNGANDFDPENFIGQQIRKNRKSHGLTQEQLAKKTGLSLTFIQNCEAGIKSPDYDCIKILADALDVSPQELACTAEFANSLTNALKEYIKHIDTGKAPLLEHFGSLNELGKKEAVKRIRELTFVPEYRKKYGE